MSTNDCDDAVKTKSSMMTRFVSLAALCGVVTGVGFVGRTAYHIATDSFVAPIVLSPDSDLVIQSKLSMSGLVAEQLRSSAKKQEIEAELYAASAAITQLQQLLDSGIKALDWTSTLTVKQASAGNQDLRELAKQKDVLGSMTTDQEAFVAQMKTDLEAGLVSKADYARERQSLNHMRIASIENERSHIVTDVQMNQVALTQKAMAASHVRGRMTTPEMMAQEELMVRVKCDLLKLEAEQRAKTAELRTIDQELTKLDELLAQMKSRPVFRAIEVSTNVAFVPYTQIDGVQTGDQVYECTWGVIACKAVGRVTELLPGEVIVPDPWGTPARGRYAIMTLDDQHAAQSRTLRVRPSSSAHTPAEPANRNRIATK